MLSRRSLLQGAAAVFILAMSSASHADDTPVPIVFVHGNNDQAAVWQAVIWRFESNGYPRDRLFAVSFLDPRARDDDDAPQPNRSSTEDQRRQLSTFVAAVRARTGADKIAFVANSRGGYAVRNYIANGGAGHVSHAVLGGTENHGIFALPPFVARMLGGSGSSEYNGWGRFLLRLNGGPSETTPGVRFLTLRSDGYDLYAQPYGTYIGHPNIPRPSSTPTARPSQGPSTSPLIMSTIARRPSAHALFSRSIRSSSAARPRASRSFPKARSR